MGTGANRSENADRQVNENIFHTDIDFTIETGSTESNMTPISVNSQSITFQEAPAISRHYNLKVNRILIAEDDCDSRVMLNTILEREVILVDLAENGRVNVQKARATNYDAILMDLQMPYMDSCEATRRIRNFSHTNLLIVAISANSFQSDTHRCLTVDRNDFRQNSKLLSRIGRINKLLRLDREVTEEISQHVLNEAWREIILRHLNKRSTSRDMRIKFLQHQPNCFDGTEIDELGVGVW